MIEEGIRTNLFKRFANAFDKHGVPIENDGGSGGGLPDPSAYDDGTALVKVGTEWKAQSGYGYEGDPAFETIEWDGDTEGKAHADISGSGEIVAYKVSDFVIPYASMNSAYNIMTLSINGETENIPFSVLIEAGVIFHTGDSGSAASSYVISAEAGTYTIMAGDSEQSVVLPEDGTYFGNVDGMFVSSLTTTPTVHTIDNKFIDLPPAPDKCLSFYLNKETGYISRAYLNGIRIENPTYDMLKNIIYDVQQSDKLIKIPIYLFFAYTPANNIFMKVTNISLVPYGGYNPEHISMYASYINQDNHKLILYGAQIWNSDDVLDLFPYEKTEYTLTPASQEQQPG